MKKVILIDGNNLLFRSYYATAYMGTTLNNSKGFPTNAVYGFVNMINKILKEEKPEYILVALDKGKTFRHEKYDFYKEGRIEMPDDLRVQFPVAMKVLDAMGIKYLEVDNYEADDIIGTIVEMAEKDEEYDSTIISSDKDLLQLISDETDVKLLKTKDHIRMDKEEFKRQYGLDPIKMIDLKALMGDPSDNIPGVKGIGEKTALKLLHEYGSLEGVYGNIDKIKGKLKEKLINDKDKAFMSFEMATIVKDVPVNITFEDMRYTGTDEKKLIPIYEEMEFFSLLKNFEQKEKQEIEIKILETLSGIDFKTNISLYLDIPETNYYNGNLKGISLYDGTTAYFINPSLLKELLEKINTNGKTITLYDNKKTKVYLNKKNIELNNIEDDIMIMAYLLEYNIKDEVEYLANQFGYNIKSDLFDKNFNIKDKEEYIKETCKKAKFIYEIKEDFINKLKTEEEYNLYKEIELPLSDVLADMELTGIYIDKEYLSKMGQEIKIKMEVIERDIYNMAGEEFNILSPKQLGVILFEKLGLPTHKKTKTGYSTNHDVLIKLKDKNPIINEILNYRTLSKLYSNYVEGLINLIYEDRKVHPIYNQTLTRTGRLSASDPNIQNIPIRENYGRLIRKAFIPSRNNIMISSDYSQIELRILAHMSKAENLVEAFKNDIDIHVKTASDIFGVDIRGVTKDMRSKAKAVNFGIVYGISGFGLSENLNMSIGEAKKFIDLYLETFPGIRVFQENIIKEAKEKGFVKTLMNRKRTISELKNKNHIIKQMGERMALNTPIQGTSADIIKKAMVEINNRFKENNIKSKMIIQVHDELIFDVVPEETEKVKTIIKETMENTFELIVPLKVEIEEGENWYEAK